MRKLSLVIGLTFFLSGLAFAQDGNDYRSRNHKFHKSNKSETTVSNHVAVNTSQNHDYNYKSRNSKFHKHDDNTRLVHKKEKIEYDYRAMNRKFKKGNLAKLSATLEKDTTLTKGSE